MAGCEVAVRGSFALRLVIHLGRPLACSTFLPSGNLDFSSVTHFICWQYGSNVLVVIRQYEHHFHNVHLELRKSGHHTWTGNYGLP
jgi:hypothetical protein